MPVLKRDERRRVRSRLCHATHKRVLRSAKLSSSVNSLGSQESGGKVLGCVLLLKG